uniref:Uncharacterized protein n=1 Tax=Athene cunicularia TaxID=194338 RepID=A0A663MPL2_ATHCN
INYLGLREWEINLRKNTNGAGGCAHIKGGNRKGLQKTRARKGSPCIFPSYLIRGHSILKRFWLCSEDPHATLSSVH